MIEKQTLLKPNCGNSTRFCHFFASILFELVLIDEYVFSASANLDFPQYGKTLLARKTF